MKIIKKIVAERTYCAFPIRLGQTVSLPVVVTLVSAPLFFWSPQAAAQDRADAQEIFGSSSTLRDTSYKITMPGAAPAFNWQSKNDEASTEAVSETRSELLFKLSFDARENLPGGSDDARWTGGLSMERIDFIPADEIKMQDISQGFAYSASLDIENVNDVVDESQIVSSSQLGVHYGRLGSVNYSGVDLGFRRFNEREYSYEQNDKDLWSLGVTTGRRFSLTGLDQNDPLWTVSLRGQFSLIEDSEDKVRLDDHLWFFSPGLHWQHDSFELSADLLMPFMNSGETEEETDYRIRAKIQKRF